MTTTDDDLEQRLRDSLRTVGAAAKPPDRLVERLHRAATGAGDSAAETTGPQAAATSLRQPLHPAPRSRAARWAPLLAAAAVVAILAVGAGVVAVHRSRTTVPTPSSDAGSPVPWSAAGGRATTEVAPLAATARAAQGTRGCVSDDFRVVSGSSKPGFGSRGWMVTTYTLVSVASTPCAPFGEALSAVLVDAQGTPLPVDAWSSGGPARLEGPPLVGPGDIVTGTVSWAVVRGATNPPANVVILPDRLVVAPRKRPPLAVSLAGVTIPPNPQNPSSGGGGPYTWRSTAEGQEVAISRPGSLASLTVTVTAPASVHLGQLLSYTVELKNPTDESVSLAGCPEVIGVLSVVPQKVAVSSGRRGPLNCSAAPRSIAPHSAVVFRMEQSSVGLVTGSGYVTWQLVTKGIAVLDARANLTVLP